MRLGLDLRGGVHLLLDVDVNALIKAQEQGDLRTVGNTLRSANIRYAGLRRQKPNGILIFFRSKKNMAQAYDELSGRLSEYQLLKQW